MAEWKARRFGKPLRLLMQLLVSAGLIAFVLHHLDIDRMKSLLRPDGTPWLLGALLLFNLSKIAGASRLNLYQRHVAILLSERENLRLYYAGMFLNLFLPGGIGGDGYKIMVLHRRQAAPVRRLLWIMLFDRVIGLLALLFLFCLFLPLIELPLAGSKLILMSSACAAAIAAVGMWAHHRLLKMRGIVSANAIVLGLAVQLLQLACMAMLLAYVRAPLAHWPAYLAVFLASSVLAVLPFSFGGLGMRELTAFYGLQYLQLEPAYGVLAASGFFLVTVVSSLPGAWCLRRLPARLPSAGQESLVPGISEKREQ